MLTQLNLVPTRCPIPIRIDIKTWWQRWDLNPHLQREFSGSRNVSHQQQGLSEDTLTWTITIDKQLRLQIQTIYHNNTLITHLTWCRRIERIKYQDQLALTIRGRLQPVNGSYSN